VELPSHGLSGTLTPHFSHLSSLKVLNLTDNYIKVSHVKLQAICEIILQASLFLNFFVFVILVFVLLGLNSHRD
jgi:hypothetical protein